jgi:hypothetical protein
MLVDRRRYYESTEMAVVGWQVGATAADRDPEWRARDNHAGTNVPKSLIGNGRRSL